MEVKIINGWPVKIWADTVEDYAMKQITNLTTLPFLYHHLAIMPDVHPGMGMPIGGVLACKDAVVPNAVGGGHRLWYVRSQDKSQSPLNLKGRSKEKGYERHTRAHTAWHGTS